MPTYDYRCDVCGHEFEHFQPISACPLKKCPACGSANVKKLISRFARLRSEDAVIDDLADPSKMGDLDDPGELRSWMKRMSKEMGEDLGDDFDEIMDEAGSLDDEDLG